MDFYIPGYDDDNEQNGDIAGMIVANLPSDSDAVDSVFELRDSVYVEKDEVDFRELIIEGDESDVKDLGSIDSVESEPDITWLFETEEDFEKDKISDDVVTFSVEGDQIHEGIEKDDQVQEKLDDWTDIDIMFSTGESKLHDYDDVIDIPHDSMIETENDVREGNVMSVSTVKIMAPPAELSTTPPFPVEQLGMLSELDLALDADASGEKGKVTVGEVEAVVLKSEIGGAWKNETVKIGDMIIDVASRMSWIEKPQIVSYSYPNLPDIHEEIDVDPEVEWRDNLFSADFDSEISIASVPTVPPSEDESKEDLEDVLSEIRAFGEDINPSFTLRDEPVMSVDPLIVGDKHNRLEGGGVLLPVVVGTVSLGKK